MGFCILKNLATVHYCFGHGKTIALQRNTTTINACSLHKKKMSAMKQKSKKKNEISKLLAHV